jgi:hypothetical protein
MTDAVTPVDGSPIGVVRSVFDGAAGTRRPSSRTIAEAVRRAVTLPAVEGARLLIELTLAGGPWNSAAVSRRPPHGTWDTWAGAGPLGPICDRFQWELGVGPGCDALTADLVSAADLIADRRWPAWRAAIIPLGGRAAAAARLHAGRTLGAFTVFTDRPVVPDRAAVEHLRTMAAHLSALLDAADRLDHLEVAMRNRGTIGQAIGLLVERYGLATDQAFAVLRRISQNENEKIAHLAAVLMETGDLPGLHQTFPSEKHGGH